MSLTVTLNGENHLVEIVRRRPHLVLRIDGREHQVTRIPEEGDGRHRMVMNGAEIDFARATLGERHIVRLDGRTIEAGIVNPLAQTDEAAAGQDAVKAPMPGAVVSIHGAVGDAVKRGETIVTIESMKLQTALPAPRDGTIAEILREEGRTFEKDDVLVLLAAVEGKD